MSHSRKKIAVVVGKKGVGKSSLIKAIASEYNIPEPPMLGVEHASYKASEEVAVNIWDTSASDRFTSIVSGYLKIADIVYLVYDVNDPGSVEEARQWYAKLKQAKTEPSASDKEFHIVLVGNKVDASQSPFPAEAAIQALGPEIRQEGLATSVNYFQVSATTGKGMEFFRSSLHKLCGVEEQPQLAEKAKEAEEAKQKPKPVLKALTQETSQYLDKTNFYYKLAALKKIIENGHYLTRSGARVYNSIVDKVNEEKSSKDTVDKLTAVLINVETVMSVMNRGETLSPTFIDALKKLNHDVVIEECSVGKAIVAAVSIFIGVACIIAAIALAVVSHGFATPISIGMIKIGAGAIAAGVAGTAATVGVLGVSFGGIFAANAENTSLKEFINKAEANNTPEKNSERIGRSFFATR